LQRIIFSHSRLSSLLKTQRTCTQTKRNDIIVSTVDIFQGTSHAERPGKGVPSTILASIFLYASLSGRK
jgi:hypothetical protein